MNNKNNYKDTIYPSISPSVPSFKDIDHCCKMMSDQPSKEKHSTIRETADQDYKLKHIKDVQFELKRNLEIRNSLRKRYNNLNNTLDYSNYALNTISFVSGVSSVSLLSTIALIPVSVILGGISAGCG